jgi:hypothetical protein
MIHSCSGRPLRPLHFLGDSESPFSQFLVYDSPLLLEAILGMKLQNPEVTSHTPEAV